MSGVRAAAVLLALLASAPAFASGFSVSEAVYRKLEAAHEAIGAERYSEARDVLTGLEGRSSLSDHERALVQQTLGYVESAQGRYGAAAKRFEACLALNALPDASARTTRYDLAQMYAADEQYTKAIPILEQWFTEVESPNASAYQLLATAYLQAGQHRKALAPARKAVSLSTKPNEGRLQLLLSILLELEDFPAAVPILEQLIQHFERSSYWLQLASLYTQTEEPSRALAVMQVAHIKGLLTTESQRRNLAQLMLFNGIPYRAAKVIEEGMADGVLPKDARTYELLGQSWLAAREYGRAVQPLEQAARIKKDGDLYVRIARAHMARNEWREASTMLERALAQPTLKDEGQARLLLGISRAYAGENAAARAAFQQAARFDKQAREARSWLSHLDDAARD